MIQRQYAILGEFGCYIFSIRKLGTIIARKTNLMSPHALYLLGHSLGMVAENAFVLDAGGLMGVLLGENGKWVCEKAGPGHARTDMILKPGEWAVLRYGLTEPGKAEQAHFVTGLGDGKIDDPMGTSRTVTLGKLVSKRIFRRVQ